MDPITLTGDGACGLITSSNHMKAVASLPQQVMLGCRKSSFKRAACPSLHTFAARLRDVPLPANVDWYTKAAVSVARMYDNDRLGCCVFAGKAHALGIWSANDPDSTPDGSTVVATDKEIQDQYFAYTGGRDSGAVITDILDYMKNPGFLASGKRYKISNYVSCDPRSKELVCAGLALLGAGTIGIDLPSAWTNSAVWDITNTRSVGGHDVTLGGYGKPNIVGVNDEGVIILSWGRLYLITWKAFTAGKWVNELYFMVPEYLWTGTDKTAPNGASLQTLLVDLQQLGTGTEPPMPGPTPTPMPPAPPTPSPTHSGVVIPDQTIVAGSWPFRSTVTVKGGTYPLVDVAEGGLRGALCSGILPGGFSILDLLKLLRKVGPVVKDVAQIIAALKSGDWTSLPPEIIQLLQDLGITQQQAKSLCSAFSN